MLPPLAERLRALPRRFLFVVGKGGVGKTTTAAASALYLADEGWTTHLISTDPAHSLGDVFQADLPAVPVASPCSASLLLEETGSALFCSDLFLQNGDAAALTENDLIEPARQALLAYEAGPLRHPMLCTRLTQNTLQQLAGLKPKLLAVMHGSSFSGNGKRALQDLSTMYAAILG